MCSTNRKRPEMKNIILASVAAAALANVAAANESASVQWTGSVTDMPDACVFVENADGTMNFENRSFVVDTPAVLRVQQRGGAILNIESSSFVERVDGGSTTGHDRYDVEVNYMAGANPSKVMKSAGAAMDKVDITLDASQVTAAKGGWGVDGGATLEVADGVWKGLEIELGGKAKLLYNDHLIENGDYAIEHTATCIQ